MITENLSTLKIHKLTQSQYDRELEAGNIDENALYLTPDEAIDLSGYATKEEMNAKADVSHSHDERYYTETEIDTKLSGKSDTSHTHSNYVPTSRTVNGKALSSNIALSASDVGALPDTTSIPDALSDLSSDSTHRTVTDTEKATWNAKSNFSGSYNDLTNKPTIPSISGLATEIYVNDVASTKVDKVTGKGLSTNDYTTTEKNKLSEIASGAEVNQNAFSNVVVGSTTIAADSKTDTLELVGSNVTITPNATDDSITFAVADGSTSTKGLVQLTNSTSSTSTTTAATPSSVKSAYDLANTAKTNADSAYDLANSKVDSLSDLGITATATEINYVGGVTSNVQTQLDDKVPKTRTVNGKALSSNITLSASDVGAYTKTEVDTLLTPISISEIDEICSATISSAEDVLL